MRWRILVLQAFMVVVLGAGAGFAFWAANFTHSFVSSQLAAQSITFPTSSTNYDTVKCPDFLTKYGGKAVNDGPTAYAYANCFLGYHLSSMPTYEQASMNSMASSKAAAADPTNQALAKTAATDANTVATVFKGNTLRFMLESAWGWWTVGDYSLIFGIVLTIGAVLALAAFIFELAVAPKKLALPEATPSYTGKAAMAPQ